MVNPRRDLHRRVIAQPFASLQISLPVSAGVVWGAQYFHYSGAGVSEIAFTLYGRAWRVRARQQDFLVRSESTTSAYLD
jgi:hypothetical protein